MKAEFNWEDAAWLINEWKKLGGDNVALKGVANVKDAVKAVDIGFDTIWVSNHGGRQLESSIPTIHNIKKIYRRLFTSFPVRRIFPGIGVVYFCIFVVSCFHIRPIESHTKQEQNRLV